MLNLSRYAKAIAALIVGLIAAASQLVLIDGGTGAFAVNLGGSLLTAGVVFFIANKVDGFNVNAIADAMFGAADTIMDGFTEDDDDG